MRYYRSVESPAILSLAELSAWPTAVVGGEAKQLAALADQGIPITPTLVVPSTLFQQLGGPDQLTQLRLLLESTEWDNPAHRADQADRVKSVVSQWHWPSTAVAAVRSAYHHWGHQAMVSLRPSYPTPTALGEWTRSQLSSPELECIQGDANLLESLQLAWAQTWTADTLLSNYQQLLGQQLPAQPWLLQLRETPQASGVAFTHQPFTHAKHVLIYAVRGEYHEVKSAIDQSSFEVDVRNHILVRRVVRPQSHQLVAVLGGWKEQSLTLKGDHSPLTTEQILELSDIVHRVKQTQFEHQVVNWRLINGQWFIWDLQPLGEAHPLADTKAKRVAVGQTVVSGQVQAQARVLTNHSADWHQLRPGEIAICDTVSPTQLSGLQTAAGLICESAISSPVVLKVLTQAGIPTIMKARQATTRIRTGEVIMMRADRGEVWATETTHTTTRQIATASQVITHVTPSLTTEILLAAQGVVWESQSWLTRQGIDPAITRYPDRRAILINKVIADSTVVTGLHPAHSWYQLGDWSWRDINQAEQGTSSESPGPNPDFGLRGIARYREHPWLLEWELELFETWRHQQPQLQLLITGVRTLSELEWLTTYLANSPYHRVLHATWLQIDNPQLVIEILTGQLPAMHGFIFNTQAIQSKMVGIDPHQPELVERYQAELGPTQHLLATTWQYLKQCSSPSGSHQTHQVPLYLSLGHLDQRWVEWGVSLGATGFVCQPQFASQLKASIMVTEAQWLDRPYANHT